MEITELVEKNASLLRLGLHLEYNDARHRIANHLQRNIDRSKYRNYEPHNKYTEKNSLFSIDSCIYLLIIEISLVNLISIRFALILLFIELHSFQNWRQRIKKNIQSKGVSTSEDFVRKKKQTIDIEEI